MRRGRACFPSTRSTIANTVTVHACRSRQVSQGYYGAGILACGQHAKYRVAAPYTATFRDQTAPRAPSGDLLQFYARVVAAVRPAIWVRRREVDSSAGVITVIRCPVSGTSVETKFS